MKGKRTLIRDRIRRYIRCGHVKGLRTQPRRDAHMYQIPLHAKDLPPVAPGSVVSSLIEGVTEVQCREVK